MMKIAYHFFLALLALLHRIVTADIILKDIPPLVDIKRDLEYRSLDLRDHDVYLWGGTS